MNHRAVPRRYRPTFLNDRTERTQVDFTVLLRDNQGSMANQSVVVMLTSTMDDASPVQITVLTAANGTRQ